MIDVQEATALIQKTFLPITAIRVPLTEALGSVLQEPVVADRDFPPFDRVMMDGIGIQYAGWEQGMREFLVEGVQLAGSQAGSLQNVQHCLEVMTGASLPSGVDTVIRYEDVSFSERDGEKYAKITVEAIGKGRNIHGQGSDEKAGTVLLDKGKTISPAEVAVMASVGHAKPLVSAPLKVAVISTGNELVPVEAQPLPHQIRQSNLQALQAALHALPMQVETHHLVDEKAILSKRIEPILKENDVLILSGGVSKGKADYVPEVLTELGIEKKFHRVAQKPGKPFWFGASAKKVVFALPGNPVSTFMCFHRYVKPWLQQTVGMPKKNIPQAVLQEEVTFPQALTRFVEVKVAYDKTGTFTAIPFPSKGSGDFANLIEADGFLELPADKSTFPRGLVLDFWPYR